MYTAHAVAFGRERRLEIAPHAVQHLELEAILRDALVRDERPGAIDDLGIVGRERGERSDRKSVSISRRYAASTSALR
jgi:hypothetical protein